MIINISGTSGSGKSTIVREIMSLYDRREALMAPPRKRPVAYTCIRKEGKKLFIPGHYEMNCGGCDTLANFFPDSMYDGIIGWIRAAHSKNADVMYEGLIMEHEVRRGIQMHKDGLPMILISIDISLEKCLEAVQKRREAKGNFKVLNPKHTIISFKDSERKRKRWVEAGIQRELLTREKSVEFIANLLGFHGKENVPHIFEKREIQPVKPRPAFSFEAYLEGRVGLNYPHGSEEP